MSFSLSELISTFRTQVDDTTEPYLWGDDEILDFLDEAEDDFCERADAIPDEIELEYEADQEWLEIPEHITQIRDARTGVTTVQVCNRTPWEAMVYYDDYGMGLTSENWRSVTGPTLRALVTDIRQGQAKLYPIPTADGSVTLEVFRRPEAPLSERGELEIVDRKQQRLILVKSTALAYGKHDAEAYNPKMAQELEVQYLQGVEELLRNTRRRRRHNSLIGYGGL